jgi:ElaB/YqjD/DUF883 family membrane-anchored ribosome-binding protein
MTSESRTAPSTTAIRADIERTRERLGDTVEALGAQLNPSHLAQRVKDTVREATIGKVQHMASHTKERMADTGRDLAQTIRDNPLPAAMAAAGIGWLLLSRREQPMRYGVSADRDPYGLEGDRSPVREMASNVTGKVQELGDKAANAADRVKEKAQDVTRRVVDSAKSTGERISETTDTALHQVRDKTRQATQRVEGQYQENPMALGAVALALGLAIGMSAPRTRREVEMVGDASDRVMDKARERIASTTERVESVIDRALPEVKEVVREAAREEGLTR